MTGAASGIGLGIAKALAGAGMNLVLADLQPDRLAAARQDIEALGAKAVGVTVDVSDAASVAAAGRAAEQAFGKLHVAVNNAGVAMHGTRVEDVSAEEWNWVIGVNVLGVINGIRTFVPMIRRHGEGGHVVNTASISGFFIRRGRNQGAYSMTKYAVVALSEALEQEVEDAGIGVSVLCPGAVETQHLRVCRDAARAVRRTLCAPAAGRDAGRDGPRPAAGTGRAARAAGDPAAGILCPDARR